MFIRRLIALCVVGVGFGFAVANDVSAAGYALATVGSGGQTEAVSGGGEIGKSGKRLSIGGGFSVARIGWTEPLQAGSYFVQEHSDEYEFYASLGVRIAAGLHLVITGGPSGSDTYGKDIVTGSTGWDSHSTVHPAVSGQLRYLFRRLLIGAGYHNRWGVVGAIGVCF